MTKKASCILNLKLENGGAEGFPNVDRVQILGA